MALAGALAAAPEAAPRFAAVRVVADSREEPLAAWQFEFTAGGGGTSLVGVEGSASFPDAFYDRAAHFRGRIVVASFTTNRILPRGRVHVATLNLLIEGDAEPKFQVKPIVGGTRGGREIAVGFEIER